MRRIAVIGGGLAGLVVAWRRVLAGDRVHLLEAAPRLGGQLFTERTQGFVVEHGAEGFVAGSEAVRVLARELGIERELVEQLVTLSYAFDGRALRALAPGEAAGLLGFQVPGRELGKGIGSFRQGMGEIVEALARGLAERVDVRLGTPVAALLPAGAAWRVESAAALDEVDGVVVATDARAASALLEPAFAEPARALAAAATVSSVTVSLAFARAAVGHPLDGTGFVVAENAQENGFRACTFASSKLPERAPAGHELLRLFFRPPGDDLHTLADEAWVTRAEQSLARALPLRGRPERAWVSRWHAALPVFDAAHRERVAVLEAAFAGRNVALAGSAFHGSGIDAAVRSAERAAEVVG